MRIAVIGGGAAGLFACCRLTDAGMRVTLFERNDRCGKKLAITGKGRCNLTNACSRQTFFDNVPRNPRFLYSAFGYFSNEDLMRYFEEDLSLPLKTERGNRVFPQSDKASDVVGALTGRLEKSPLFDRIQARVTAVRTHDGAVSGVTAGGRDRDFDRVLLCTGGLSYPSTGSDGDGHRIAAALGHTIVEPRPSLVPLETYGHLAQSLQGLSLKNTALTLYDTESDRPIYSDFGELLFTHFGLSGPTVLSASAHMRQALPGRYEIRLDLKPALDEQTLDKRILSDFEKYKNRDFSNALRDLLPAKLIPVMVGLSGIPARKKVNEITRAERQALLSHFKCLRFRVKGFRPIDEAIITSGGVDTKEVVPATMQSKLVQGLYFAGEILDVDAYTGGFNLQIAFSTAALAARAMMMT